ncbi:hypothetical protein BV25DRAFT_1812014 [Artomyces pyxidatus]|uniref:Uncharacterized protein n=1 Tax=Artomyces pyxidatus TaxID=48021 RepID=A0ACB8SM98_9AGAM|nr:hypothetical protein BV25DRAFT_1812014 [Artomyces pyxidatus]
MFTLEVLTDWSLSQDFLRSVYCNPLDAPDVIFYNNNCQLQAHLHAQNDNFFHHSILAVDVFYFKCKHKETDKFCQKHCNSALWPELNDGNGKWIFNSWAAEQANAWMGEYLAIVWEMLAYSFDFFLDKVIKRRNKITIVHLEEQGQVLYTIPPADM